MLRATINMNFPRFHRNLKGESSTTDPGRFFYFSLLSWGQFIKLAWPTTISSQTGYDTLSNEARAVFFVYVVRYAFAIRQSHNLRNKGTTRLVVIDKRFP